MAAPTYYERDINRGVTRYLGTEPSSYGDRYNFTAPLSAPSTRTEDPVSAAADPYNDFAPGVQKTRMLADKSGTFVNLMYEKIPSLLTDLDRARRYAKYDDARTIVDQLKSFTTEYRKDIDLWSRTSDAAKKSNSLISDIADRAQALASGDILTDNNTLRVAARLGGSARNPYSQEPVNDTTVSQLLADNSEAAVASRTKTYVDAIGLDKDLAQTLADYASNDPVKPLYSATLKEYQSAKAVKDDTKAEEARGKLLTIQNVYKTIEGQNIFARAPEGTTVQFLNAYIKAGGPLTNIVDVTAAAKDYMDHIGDSQYRDPAEYLKQREAALDNVLATTKATPVLDKNGQVQIDPTTGKPVMVSQRVEPSEHDKLAAQAMFAYAGEYASRNRLAFDFRSTESQNMFRSRLDEVRSLGFDPQHDKGVGYGSLWRDAVEYSMYKLSNDNPTMLTSGAEKYQRLIQAKNKASIALDLIDLTGKPTVVTDGGINQVYSRISTTMLPIVTEAIATHGRSYDDLKADLRNRLKNVDDPAWLMMGDNLKNGIIDNVIIPNILHNAGDSLSKPAYKSIRDYVGVLDGSKVKDAQNNTVTASTVPEVELPTSVTTPTKIGEKNETVPIDLVAKDQHQIDYARANLERLYGIGETIPEPTDKQESAVEKARREAYNKRQQELKDTTDKALAAQTSVNTQLRNGTRSGADEELRLRTARVNTPATEALLRDIAIEANDPAFDEIITRCGDIISKVNLGQFNFGERFYNENVDTRRGWRLKSVSKSRDDVTKTFRAYDSIISGITSHDGQLSDTAKAVMRQTLANMAAGYAQFYDLDFSDSLDAASVAYVANGGDPDSSMYPWEHSKVIKKQREKFLQAAEAVGGTLFRDSMARVFNAYESKWQWAAGGRAYKHAKRESMAALDSYNKTHNVKDPYAERGVTGLGTENYNPLAFLNQRNKANIKNDENAKRAQRRQQLQEQREKDPMYQDLMKFQDTWYGDDGETVNKVTAAIELIAEQKEAQLGGTGFDKTVWTTNAIRMIQEKINSLTPGTNKAEIIREFLKGLGQDPVYAIIGNDKKYVSLSDDNVLTGLSSMPSSGDYRVVTLIPTSDEHKARIMKEIGAENLSPDRNASIQTELARLFKDQYRLIQDFNTAQAGSSGAYQGKHPSNENSDEN